MTDNEKFEGFKKSLVNENEQKYGDEIRGRYGDVVQSFSGTQSTSTAKKYSHSK